MAAAPFTVTFVFKGKNGKTMYVPATVSDVAGAYAIYPDGSNILQLPADQPYWLVDEIVVTGGTDTNFLQLYANQLNSGLSIANKANLNTSNFRMFATNPVGFKPGSQLKFVQAA